MAIPAELALRAFILDYLNKRGLTSAAEGLRADQLEKGEQAIARPPVDSPNGFLFEWFGTFWDVFSSRLGSRAQKSRIHMQQQQLRQNAPPRQRNAQNPPAREQQRQQRPASQPLNAELAPGMSRDNLFPHPQRQQMSQAMLNHAAFRNMPSSAIPTAQMHLQNQQLRQQQQQQQRHQQQRRQHEQSQQQALLQAAQRNSQTGARMQNLQENRRLPQNQINVQSLSLESALQGQKATLPQDQTPISGDIMDMNSPLDLFTNVPPTRSTPPRTNGMSNAAAAAAMAASGRGMMQMGARGHPPQVPAGGNAQTPRGNSASGKHRSFNGMPVVGSEAPSTASRRGGMDLSVNVNRPYDDAVEDESQPRNGPNASSSSLLTKKRTASQSISRKSAASAQAALSPRAPFGTNSQGGGPAKRQRGTGAYQGSVGVSPVVQQLQHQKQLSGVDLDQIPQGLQQGQTGQNQVNGRNASAQYVAMQQRQQPFGQEVNRLSNANAQFLSQLSEKAAAGTHGGRFPGLGNSVPGQPGFQSQDQVQNARQRDFLQEQGSVGQQRNALAAGNERIGDTAKGQEARGGAPKSNDPNFAASQAASGLSFSPDQMPMATVSQGYMIKLMMQGSQHGALPSNSAAFAGLQSAMQSAAKPSADGPGDNRAGSNDRRERGGGDKQTAEIPFSNAMQPNAQRLLDGSGLKGNAPAMRLRQQFNQDDILKPSEMLPIPEQDINPNKKSQPESNITSNSKVGNERDAIKRNTSSRAMKTIETTSGMRARRTQETASSKANGLAGNSGQLPQSGAGSMGAKRDKGVSGEGEVESRSTKSDRQIPASRGGGTPSQKSVASGASGAVEGRGSQGTTSAPTRRGRGRGRGRGGAGGRRGKAAAPRGSGSSRAPTPTQAGRAASLDHKSVVAATAAAATASSALQLANENVRGMKAETDAGDISGALMGAPRANAQGMNARVSNRKGDRQNRGMPKHNNNDQGPKLSFEPEDDTTQNTARGHDQNQTANLHQDVLDMLGTATGDLGAGRAGGEASLEQVDKALNMSHFNFVTGNGSGKLGNQPGTNYTYDIPPYLATGVEDENVFNNVLNMGLPPPPTEFEDDTII